MVTFCVGMGIRERGLLGEGVIRCENDEVVYSQEEAASSISIPFSNFSILEYIRYQRALIDRNPLQKKAVKERLNLAKIKKSPSKKLKRLCPVEFRGVTLASKLDIPPIPNIKKEEPDTVFLNFNHLPPTAKNKRRLNKYIQRLERDYKIFVSVSSEELVPKGGKIFFYCDKSDIPRVIRK